MPFDAACMKYHACLIELIQTLKAFTHCTQNCKDFFKKVGEKIVVHIKNCGKNCCGCEKNCSMYGR